MTWHQHQDPGLQLRRGQSARRLRTPWAAVPGTVSCACGLGGIYQSHRPNRPEFFRTWGRTPASTRACRQDRGGKLARDSPRCDIVVNTDASVQIAQDALRPLITAFVDPTDGVASGCDVSVASGDSEGNAGESGYVVYEMWVRGLETCTGCVVGAPGCFYATYRHLYTTALPQELSSDFAAPREPPRGCTPPR